MFLANAIRNIELPYESEIEERGKSCESAGRCSPDELNEALNGITKQIAAMITHTDKDGQAQNTNLNHPR